MLCGPYGVECLSVVCGQAEHKERTAPPWGQLGYKASTRRAIPDPWGALQEQIHMQAKREHGTDSCLVSASANVPGIWQATEDFFFLNCRAKC